MPTCFACGVYTYVSVRRYLVLLERPGSGEQVFLYRQTDRQTMTTDGHYQSLYPLQMLVGELSEKGKGDEMWHKVAVGNIQQIGCFSKMIQHEHLAEEYM